MSKVVILMVFITLFFACNNDSTDPVTKIPLNSVLSITNDDASDWTVVISESGTATEVLTIENGMTAYNILPTQTQTWNISWTGLSGETQYITRDIYTNPDATGPIDGNGDQEIIGGQTVSINLSTFVP